MPWPRDPAALVAAQEALGRALPPADYAPPDEPLVAATFVAFPREHSGPGAVGDPAWVGAALCRGIRLVAGRSLRGVAGAPYRAGLLALREGPLLEAVVRLLPGPFDVCLVDGTGLDHPRGAGIAVQLGAELGVPTVGVTHRPLLARGAPPDGDRQRSDLELGGRPVAAWVVTRPGTRPLVAHAGWRTSVDTAVVLVGSLTHLARTPEPLRQARRIARTSRTGDSRYRIDT